MRAVYCLTFVVALVAAWPTAAQAQWKWRDAQGRVTLSDRPPPPEVPAKDILLKPAGADAPRKSAPAAADAGAAQGEGSPAANSANAPAPGPAAGKTATAATPGTDPELEARRKKLEQEAAAKRRQDEERNAATMKDNCARARNGMTSLESGQRISRTNDKGEREVLDDAQRAAEMTRTREIIAQNCKS